MSTRIKREIYAILFFAIFFAKTFISVSPLFIPQFDRDALLQVVLQLEIENNNGKSGLGDQANDYFGKYDPRVITHFNLQAPTCLTERATFVGDDERLIRAFYPSVPTPPPNC